MERAIATSLSPNTRPEDIRQAHRVLWHPSTWNDLASLPEITATLSSVFRGAMVSLTSSGRQAIFDTLHAAGIGAGDEVIVQAFTCIAVPEPVIWVKATPVYADIAEGTYNMDPEDVRAKITKKTKAIIVQHTFGIPADIEALRRIADEHNLLLIEDCAHALGGSYKGKPLGTFGDVAILSFGRDKTISSVYGGAVVSRNQSFIHAIQQRAKSRSLPPATWVAQQLLHPLIFSLVVPTYFTGGIGKALLIASQQLGLLSKAVEQKERQGIIPQHISYRFSPALGHLLRLQVRQIAEFTRRRQHIADTYMQELGGVINTPLVPANGKPAWLRFPLQVADPVKLHCEAKREEILLGDWYNAPLVPSACSLKVFKYNPGSCPNAEAAASHVVNLPTYPLLRDVQVKRVIDFVKTHGKQ